MADVELVIRLPEEDYETLMNINDDRLPSVIARKHLYNALANGKPLPKGHGDLKDIDDVKVRLLEIEGDDFTIFNLCEAIENTPTIIEADMAESET